MLVTELVSQPEMFALNADARSNMVYMLVTELVFQPEMSALNCVESKVPPDPSFSCRPFLNKSAMFVIPETSQSGISSHPATPHRAVAGSPQFAS
jgi:hypothetical protein